MTMYEEPGLVMFCFCKKVTDLIHHLICSFHCLVLLFPLLLPRMSVFLPLPPPPLRVSVNFLRISVCKQQNSLRIFFSSLFLFFFHDRSNPCLLQKSKTEKKKSAWNIGNSPSKSYTLEITALLLIISPLHTDTHTHTKPHFKIMWVCTPCFNSFPQLLDACIESFVTVVT